MIKFEILKSSYRPSHQENKMRDEGNVVKARNNYLSGPSNNLRFLLKERYSWMNDFIKEGDSGIEVGGGTGVSKFYIKSESFLVTDFSDNEWLDVKNVDALATPFNDESFNFVIASNMIHHIPYPKRFFKEMHRILKTNGLLMIQDINASLLMRAILRLMKHEGYSYEPDVFDESQVCTNPCDLWSANCAISNLLFDNRSRFEEEIPFFKIIRHEFTEFFTFFNSGGVIAKTFFIPLPMLLCEFLKVVDDILTKRFPNIFALQMRIVLQKT